MIDLIIGGLGIWFLVWLFIKIKNKVSDWFAPVEENITVPFTDGPVDNIAVELARAFTLIAKHHYDCCRFEMGSTIIRTTGVYIRFQDYADNSCLKTLIDDNNADWYLKTLKYLGDEGDCGYVLRHYGYRDGDYWIVRYDAPISKATAQKAYEILSTSSRFTPSLSASQVYAYKSSD